MWSAQTNNGEVSSPLLLTKDQKIQPITRNRMPIISMFAKRKYKKTRDAHSFFPLAPTYVHATVAPILMLARQRSSTDNATACERRSPRHRERTSRTKQKGLKLQGNDIISQEIQLSDQVLLTVSTL